MGETDGEIPDETAAGEVEQSPAPQDTLQVPTQKRRRIKSPTPGSIRGRSMTPIRGRSQTPFNLYLNRRSATPMTYRSITPFLKREDKEKTPFELGRDIHTQLICNSSVFDKALIMDITEPEVPPVRYITSDMSVIDRAAVMDVSNVEVIYVVEEYEEYEEEEEEEVVVEVVKKKKGKGGKKGGKAGRKSVDKEGSVDKESSVESGLDREESEDREDSVDLDEPVKKTKKKAAPKKKKETTPKLPSLKLEIGGGQQANKKLFDQPGPGAARPPPKKSALAIQMEEQAKAAAKAAEEAAKAKPKGETFEERQKRLKEEAEEQARLEEEQRLQEEEEAAAAEDAGEDGDYGGEEGGEEGGEDGDEGGEGEEGEDENRDEEEEEDQFEEAPVEKRRGSDDSDDFVRPDPDDEEKWQRIASIEGVEFMQNMRKFSRARQVMKRSEKERDADWQRQREQFRRPAFINFLTDRTAEVGQNVRMVCAVWGNADLSVKWFKDGKQLERDATHRIANNNNILSLEICNTVPSDSGEYSCVIADMNDEVSSSCIVTIYEVFKDEPSPPTFSLIRDFYHLHDDELTIECHAHGIPRPKITWWRSAFEIKPSYKFTILEEAHGVYKLMIFRPTSRDSGIYKCKASNSSGEAEIIHSIEVTKNKNYHIRGIFHARDRIQQDKELGAKRQMEDAMKSMEESDRKRAQSVEPRSYRAPPEPVVAPKNKLRFATQLRDRIALEGQTVKLFCNVTGPDPACRWFKDEKILTVGPKVRNLSEAGKAVIELLEVDNETSGVYKCVARNDFNEIETSCYLKIHPAKIDADDEAEPMFALPLRDVYHSSENDLIIDTKVRGNPRPTIEWVKDDVPVVLDARIQQIEHLDGVCELIINKPTPKDAGKYTCTATNKLGSVKSEHTVAVDILPASRRSSGASASEAAKEAEAQETKEGDAAPKDISGRPPPKGVVRHRRDEEGDPTYERRSRMPDPAPKNKLYFTVHLTNRYVQVGAKVKLQAIIGGPEPQIRWQKNGENVTFGGRFRNMTREGGMAVLGIDGVLEEDSGLYTVIARNEWSDIQATALLHVYSTKASTDVEPVFTRSLKDTYHLNTNELILESHVRGIPHPTIQWFKDSIEITNNAKHQIFELPDGTIQLIIDKPDKKDSGKYVIKAESKAGKAEISHQVVFKDVSSKIAENIHGVFHADPSLLRKKEDEKESAPAAGGEGKGKKKAEEEEEFDVQPAASSGTTKEPKREKKIGIHFKAFLCDRVVAEGSKVKLTCFVEGTEPVVKWSHNDQPVVFGPKSKINWREGLATLELVGVTEEEGGEYKCTAKDASGEVVSTCKLTVYASGGSADVQPTFTRNIKDTYHSKINEFVLDVHVRGVPHPTITWVKDGVKIEPSEKYQLRDHEDGTCELIICDPAKIDSGKYVCQAENRAGKAEIVHPVTIDMAKLRPGSPPPAPKPKEESAEEKQAREEARRKKKQEEEEAYSSRREVPPPPDLRKKVRICNSLPNRTVPEGTNVRWSVYVDGPEPTAKWFHNDEPIAFGPKHKLSFQDGLAIMNLMNAVEEDSGVWKLLIRGAENQDETSCNLMVYKTGKVEESVYAPVFTRGINDTYYLTENELVLDCRVRGNPRPEIEWMVGRDMISNNEKYQQFDQADGYCKLVISNPTQKDSGIYTCTARNSVQEAKITHHVNYGGQDKVIFEKTHGFFHRDPNKPHFANALGNHIITPGGTLTITAEFAPSTTPLEVQWFRDKSSLAGQPKVKTFNDKGVYTLAVQELQFEGEGVYTCRASNAFGKVESNANVHIATTESKAEKPPLFLSRPDPEMKIAVNDPFSISFRVQGEPKPKLSLLKGLKDITNSDRVSKEVSDDYMRFTVHKAQVPDSGTYFVVARNEFGTDRIFVTITVKTPKKKDQ